MSPTLTLVHLSAPIKSSSPRSITPVTPGQPPLETRPKFSIVAEQQEQNLQTRNGVFNYYFLFLALLAVALAALFWWINRRKRFEQERIRSRGQHALFRDVERWTIHRRNRSPIVEGLNESGEAPPPYKPKGGAVETLEPGDIEYGSSEDVTAPPRAFCCGSTETVQPPDYVEINRMRESGGVSEQTAPAYCTKIVRNKGSTP